MSLRRAFGAFALVTALSLPALAQAGTGASPPPADGQGMCPCGHGQMGMGSSGKAGHGQMGAHHGAAMSSCRQVEQMANLTVENTSRGASVRVEAKDPAQAQQVQQLVQQCMQAREQMHHMHGTQPGQGG